MRKIEIEVKNCMECPLRVYDPEYGMTYDSGFNCNHPEIQNIRIIDDSTLKKISINNEKIKKGNEMRKKEYKESLLTLFPKKELILEPLIENPLYNFPKNCPLK